MFGLRSALVGVAASLFYLVFASRIIRAASAGVFAVDSTSFASVSRKALNSAFVIPSGIPSLPFLKGFPSLPYNDIIVIFATICKIGRAHV